MADAHTTGSLAELLKAELIGPPGLVITGVDALHRAGPETMTFIRSPAYAGGWPSSRAGAALVRRGVEVPGHDPTRRALLIVPDADTAMIRLLTLFAPPLASIERGVHPTAVVHPTATLGEGVAIGPFCLVGAGASIGEGSVLVCRVQVADKARVGRHTTLRAGVTILDRCTVGDRCILHPGVVLGADGFGFHPSPDGRGVVKVPHSGYVEVGDDVEIGANSCIDRGKFGPTTIGSGTKIDNLVQIAHNCVVGRGCLLCGQVALAGSVTLGDNVTIGGQAGLADGVTIGPGTQIGAQTGVHNDISGGTWLGTPARPGPDTGRIYAALGRLDELIRRVRALERATGGRKRSETSR